ncbi:MAG: transglycosylase SLT domain-containing protein [Oligoflexia bacterium]|nr:transglycosylase SLT domain-containing protein [Oligoflexia bacterium]
MKLLLVLFLSSGVYCKQLELMPRVEMPLVENLDVASVMKQKRKDPRYRSMYNFMLGVAYVEKADYEKAYLQLKKTPSIPYLEDYIRYYRSLSGCRYSNNITVIKESVEELYYILSRGRGNIVEKAKNEVAGCEFKLAKNYAISGNLSKSVEYLVRARDRNYSDLESEFYLIKLYIKMDKKLAYGLMLDLYKRFGQDRVKSYFSLLPESVSKDLLSYMGDSGVSGKSRDSEFHLEESHLIDSMLLAYNENNYGEFRNLAEKYFLKYPEGIYLKKFHNALCERLSVIFSSRIRSASYFEDVLKYFSLDKIKSLALLCWKYSDWDNAEFLLKLMREKFPNDSDPYYFLASFYEDRGQFDEARDWYERLVKKFPGSRFYPRGLFKVSWIDLKNREYKKCAEGFTRYVVEGNDSFDWDITPALFFGSHCKSQSGRTEDAVKDIDELLRKYPYSFYSLVSRNRRNISLVDEINSSIKGVDSNIDAVSGQQLYTIQTALKLLRAGLVRDASDELSGLDFNNLSPKYSEIVAGIYRHSASPNMGISFSYKLLSGFKRYLSRMHAESHFPLLYYDTLDYFSKNTGVEPYILISVIRRESAFRPDAVSSAGAMGLMQVMPDTAKRIDPDVNASDLTSAETNIRVATLYIKELLQKYKGNLVYVLANYSAGEQAVERWIKWYGKDTDMLEFIEGIPVQETRWYVKSVLSNYYMYNALYVKKDVSFIDLLSIGYNSGGVKKE